MNKEILNEMLDVMAELAEALPAAEWNIKLRLANIQSRLDYHGTIIDSQHPPQIQ